jgi:hypothetical protein
MTSRRAVLALPVASWMAALARAQGSRARSDAELVQLSRKAGDALAGRSKQIPEKYRPQGLDEALGSLQKLLAQERAVVFTALPDGPMQIRPAVPRPAAERNSVGRLGELAVDRTGVRDLSDWALEAILAREVVRLLPARPEEMQQLAPLSERFGQAGELPASALRLLEQKSSEREDLMRYCGLWVRHALEATQLELAVVAAQAKAQNVEVVQHLRRVADELRDPLQKTVLRGKARLIQEGRDTEEAQDDYLRYYLFAEGPLEHVRQGLYICAHEAWLEQTRLTGDVRLSFLTFLTRMMNKYVPRPRTP